MISLKTILVATDFSEPSEVAVRYGRALAEAFHASLHVLHVLPDSVALPWATMADGLAMADVQRQWEREADERLQRMLPEGDRESVHAVLVTRAGDPVRQVTRYAAETGAESSSCSERTAAGRWPTCSWEASPSAWSARRPARSSRCGTRNTSSSRMRCGRWSRSGLPPSREFRPVAAREGESVAPRAGNHRPVERKGPAHRALPFST